MFEKVLVSIKLPNPNCTFECFLFCAKQIGKCHKRKIEHSPTKKQLEKNLSH